MRKQDDRFPKIIKIEVPPPLLSYDVVVVIVGAALLGLLLLVWPLLRFC